MHSHSICLHMRQFCKHAQFAPSVEVVNLCNPSPLCSDGWVMDPSAFGTVQQYNGFFHLEGFVAGNSVPGLAWQDVLPFVR